VVLIGVLAIVLLPAREPLSLKLLVYLPGAQTAKLKLINRSSKTITYLTDQHGGAVLGLTKTSTGWSNSLPEIISATRTYTGTAKPTPAYFAADPGFLTNLSLARFEALETHELEPGQSAVLYIWFQADGSPTRVGTVCIVSQGKLAQQFGRWINRVKSWCHMRARPPGQVEVWCNEPLPIYEFPTNGTTKKRYEL
jgi:hypothetical protein